MSERELRNQLESILSRFQYDYESLSILPNPTIEVIPEVKRVRQALATEPDWTQVARWANERRAFYLKAAETECAHSGRLNKDFYRGKAGMAAELQELCGKHVRLTETGWEWTDD